MIRAYLFLILITSSSVGFSHTPTKGIIENKGQIRTTDNRLNEEVLFLRAGISSMNVQFRKEGISFDTYRKTEKGDFAFHRLDLNFLGASSKSIIKKGEPLLEKKNFVRGDRIIQGVNTYASLRYENLYPGVHLIAKGAKNSEGFKYDFVLDEGADVNDIQMNYRGYDAYSIEGNTINFKLSGRILTEHIPESWISKTGERIDVEYKIIEEGDSSLIVGFEICDDNHDGKSLVIDPEVVAEWSTYHGDSLYDTANDIATDVWGFVFIAGTTNSLQTIASAGAYQNTYAGGSTDAVLTRMNQHGLRQWSTYYGGSGADSSKGICMDYYHRIYLVGVTTSTDSIGNEESWQMDNAGGTDGFIATFGREGNFLRDTYLGGSNDDEICDCFAFDDGRVVVTGTTQSAELFGANGVSPVQSYNANKDVFAASFSSDGALISGTFAGGEGDDIAAAIDINDSSYVYIAANTNSTSGISTPNAAFSDLNGASDGFVMKSDTTFNVMWSTYFGGVGSDFITDIDAVSDSTIFYLGGYTDGEINLTNDTISAQTESGGLEDGFVAKLSENGTHDWFTYSGGPGDDRIVSIQFDIDSSLYAVGVTTSDTGLVFFDEDSVPSEFGGGIDSYLARYDEKGPRIYTRYIGGEGNDQAEGLAVYGRTAYFVVGSTDSETNMVLTSQWQPTAHQNSYQGGGSDAFFARFTGLYSTDPPDCEDCPWDGGTGPWGGGSGSGGSGSGSEPQGPPVVCLGDSILISVGGGALGQNALWIWYKDSCGTDAFIDEGWSIWVQPDTTTTYYVRSEGPNRVGSCSARPVIVEEPFDMTASVNDSICAGEPLVFQADSAITYSWIGPDTIAFEGSPHVLDSTTALNIGWYYVTGTGLACTDTDSVQVETIFPNPIIEADIFDPTCVGLSDGSITVSPLDTTINLFSWLDIPSDTLFRDSLPDGFYPYEAENIYGCQTNSGFALSEPSNPIDSLRLAADTCGQGVGRATVFLESGWNEDFDLAWSTGLDSNIVNSDGYSAGTYSVLVYNAYDCIFSEDFTISNFGEFSTQIVPDSIYLEFEATGEAQVFNTPEPTEAIYFWTPTDGISCSDCPNPIFNPDTTTWFYLDVESALGCSATDSIFVEREIPPPTTFIPTVFSPNNDGLNDELCVLGNRILEVDFSVYNRWGEEVFSTKDASSCWDGTLNGQPLSGAMVYTFRAKLEEGIMVEESGNINILR